MINGSKGPVLCEEWFRYDPILGSVNNYTFYVTADTQTPVLYKYIGSSGELLGFQDDPNYDWFLVHYLDVCFFLYCDWRKINHRVWLKKENLKKERIYLLNKIEE